MSSADAFNVSNPEEHAKRRRLMGQLYNRSKMENLQGLMTLVIDDFVQTLKQHFQDKLIDCPPACRALEADLMCKFGRSFQVELHR